MKQTLCTSLVVLFAALLFFGRGSAGEPPQAGAEVTTPDPNELVHKLLPRESWHGFARVDPLWQLEFHYLKPQPDSFEMITPKDAGPDPSKYYKSLRYSPRGKKRPDVKILRYYPEGQLYGEIDNTETEHFSRSFFRDGRLRTYDHRRSGKRVSAINVNPTTGKPSYYTGGSGMLTQYSFTKGKYSRLYCHKGGTFLVLNYKDHLLTDLDVYPGDGGASGDHMRLNAEAEHLWLFSEREFWTRLRDGEITYKIMDLSIDGATGKTKKLNVPFKKDVRPISRWDRSRPGEVAKIRAQWKVVYPARRKALLDRCSAVFKDAGHTWKSLGVEWVLTPGAWPAKPQTGLESFRSNWMDSAKCQGSHDDESGGWAVSKNRSRKIDFKVPAEQKGKLYIQADPDVIRPYAGQYRGMRLLLVNDSKRGLAMDAQDSRILTILLEAKDPEGRWRLIQSGRRTSWCGNSYHSVILVPGEYFDFTVPVYGGHFETKLRYRCSNSFGGGTVYSNEFDGSIHKTQFREMPEEAKQRIIRGHLKKLDAAAKANRKGKEVPNAE